MLQQIEHQSKVETFGIVLSAPAISAWILIFFRMEPTRMKDVLAPFVHTGDNIHSLLHTVWLKQRRNGHWKLI
jgi:hypothetical protein